ncbi:MAG: hypothetical protein JWQ57_3184 [Mucilaginibacter sp.]|nr:hypothetical protein [Mucilaginibacter sp.]
MVSGRFLLRSRDKILFPVFINRFIIPFWIRYDAVKLASFGFLLSL